MAATIWQWADLKEVHGPPAGGLPLHIASGYATID
jgi:hypothetical protein